MTDVTTLCIYEQVDVIKCVQEPIPTSADTSLHGPDPVEIYALSCFGWGMAGAVALKADKLRWLPGQRSMRYDIAGFVSLIQDWPVADKGILEYREAIEGKVSWVLGQLPFCWVRQGEET